MKIPDNTIIIETSGGCVRNVFANGNQSVLIVDWDEFSDVEDIKDGADCRPEWMAADDPATMSEDTEAIIEEKLPDLRDK